MLLSAAERSWAWTVALLVMTAVSLPYVLLVFVAPPGTVFWSFLNNPDDHCVYLAWMRQAEQGRFFFENLFTGDEQRGRTINLFFWALGTIARITTLPLALVYHLARFAFGALLLFLVYCLAACFTEDRLTRRAALGFAALSSGLGWAFWPLPQADALRYPVDTWQPEAVTFLTLYTNGLFCAAMAAMVGLFLCLLLAQRTGRRGYVIGAGVLGFLLGNFHSYDVITVAAVWAVYLLVQALITRRVPLIEVRQAMIAGLIGLPSVLYQYYLLRSDPVFQARAAVPTPSTAPIFYLVGYGLLIPLAVMGALRLLRQRTSPGGQAHFLIVWAIVGLAVIYLPMAFQRKLAEGLHIPIALLAASGAVAVAERLAQWRMMEGGLRVRGRFVRVNPQWIVVALLVLTVPSNLRFVSRDWQNAINENKGSTGLHPVFWLEQDVEAMRRLEEWVPSFALVQALPTTSCLIPAMSGRRVWAGHWGETPDFRRKFGEAVRFFQPDTPSDWRRQFLARTRITHIFAGVTERELSQGTLGQEPFLRSVHRLGETILYQVVPDGR